MDSDNRTSTASSVLGVCILAENQPKDAISVCIAVMYILFGVVYTLFGYRCFKAVMFLTGFIFASVLVYLICIQEKLLPAYANAGIALLAGVLFGLITMLVEYVGLFVTGFHTGLLLGLAALAMVDQLYQPQTLLAIVGNLLASGLVFAVLNLLWKRSLTILGTCVYGGGLIAGAVDLLLSGSNSARWLWRPRSVTPCYPVLALWPVTAIIGLLVQALVTAPAKPRNLNSFSNNGPTLHQKPSRLSSDIRKDFNKLIEIYKKSWKTSEDKAKQGMVRGRTREQRAEARQNKYRYLYQVRTQHGDVISQSYVQALQNKVVGPGETSTLESDATHLTMLPDGQPDLNRSANYYR